MPAPPPDHAGSLCDGPTTSTMRRYQGCIFEFFIASLKAGVVATARSTPNTARSARLGAEPDAGGVGGAGARGEVCTLGPKPLGRGGTRGRGGKGGY